MEHTGRVDWEIREGIGIITLNNPPENYLYEPEFVPLDTLKRWTSSPDLKGILIHGKGKHFSAGGDLSRMYEMIRDEIDLEKKVEAGETLLRYLTDLSLPLVAAIHGICFGGGLELALACHIRIAGEHSLFACPESTHNLMPGMGGTFRLPSTIGDAAALKMMLSGDMINAEEALLLKLIDYIVPKEEVFDFSFQMLTRMTTATPVEVIRSVIKALQNASALPPEKAVAKETQMFCRLARAEAQRRLSETDN